MPKPAWPSFTRDGVIRATTNGRLRDDPLFTERRIGLHLSNSLTDYTLLYKKGISVVDFEGITEIKATTQQNEHCFYQFWEITVFQEIEALKRQMTCVHEDNYANGMKCALCY